MLINRFDLLYQITREIESYAGEENIPIVGKIPFDPAVVTSVRQGIPITRADCPASQEFLTVWDHIISELEIP